MTAARVVQISDSHFAAALGPPPTWRPLLDWLVADPPDLVVHSGDIVLEDPDDDADRVFARALLAELPAPYVVIPGNHDIGGYDERARRSARIERFVATWGHDRFAVDVGAWRLVGANAYLLGDDADHDAWLHDACDTGTPVLCFVHQPLRDDPHDGWEMPATAAAAFEAAIAGTPVVAVASGHRHCAARRDDRGRHAVWAPSLRLTGSADSAGAAIGDVDVRPGLVEHVLGDDGGYAAPVRRPWAEVPTVRT